MVAINLHLEIGMLGRISLVDRRADHGSRTSARLDCPSMGFAINSLRQSTHDHDARQRKLSSESARAASSVVRHFACADDRNRRVPEQLEVTGKIKVSGPL